MCRYLRIGCLIACVALTGTATAGESCWHWSLTHWCCPWCPRLRPCCGCPDDYCPKSMPLTRPFLPCEPDDYCRKKMPLTPCWDKYGPDDYCPKECPPIPKLCWPPWYTCGPAAPAVPP
jgi:hypothetical protein